MCAVWVAWDVEPNLTDGSPVSCTESFTGERGGPPSKVQETLLSVSFRVLVYISALVPGGSIRILPCSQTWLAGNQKKWHFQLMEFPAMFTMDGIPKCCYGSPFNHR
jgi:hypothetical protein